MTVAFLVSRLRPEPPLNWYRVPTLAHQCMPLTPPLRIIAQKTLLYQLFVKSLRKMKNIARAAIVEDTAMKIEPIT